MSEPVDAAATLAHNWAPAAVVVIATGVVGLLIRAHREAVTTYDATARQLEAELARQSARNAALETDLDEGRARERALYERERELELRIRQLEGEVSMSERLISSLTTEVAALRTELAVRPPEQGGT